MRKTLMLFCGLSLITALYAQDKVDYEVVDTAKLMVTYDLVYRNDSTVKDYGKREDMILLIGNDVSCFQSYLYYKQREFFMTRQPGISVDVLLQQNWVPSDIRYVIYKNLPKNSINVTEHVPFTGDFEYEETPTFEWVILDDTMSIGGYLAQKATVNYGGRTWDAWFTDELPISDGPYKFLGLPGLILNMTDSKKDYRFSFKSIERLAETVTIKKERKEIITTTKEKLFKIQDELAEHVLSGFNSMTSDDAKHGIYAGMKSFNNPIELERK